MKTPYFILETNKIETNYQFLNNLCKNYLKSYEIAYSLKTNSLKQVIKTLSNQGSGFEAASKQEILLCPKNAFKIFNSPAKTLEELKLAIEKSFLINLDSFSEIKKIKQITKGKKQIEIGLRFSNQGKFGFLPNQIPEIINKTKEANLKIIGIHYHQGTNQSPTNYENNLKTLSEIITEYKLKLKYIDLGGGLPDKSQLKNLSTDLEAYIKLISKYLGKFNSTIILEPGRYLVADSMFLITKVIAVKQTDRLYAILDAGINLLPKITLAIYKFTQLTEKNKSNKEENKKQYTLAGPLLFSNDLLGQISASLIEGDLIKVENVGAYCIPLSWSISYTKPKIVIK